MIAIRRMMLGVPVPDTSPYLAQKVEASILCQVPEVADQVCDGMLVASSAVLLENFDRLGGPGDVVSVGCCPLDITHLVVMRGPPRASRLALVFRLLRSHFHLTT